MKLVTNGFPKSGNHALVKACELLGQPAQVNHIPVSEGLPKGTTHHLFIKRDPRNVVVSALRFSGNTVTPGMFLSQFRKFLLADGRSLVDSMAQYEGWLTHPQTLVIRFEDLIASDKAMHDIANYLDVPYINGAFEELPGLTRTWTGKLSDYRMIWTPEVKEQWDAEEGQELLIRWGY